MSATFSPVLSGHGDVRRGSGDYLARLPTELLFTIKESIPDSDLRTHVCFHQSHPRMQSLYGTEERQEEFFKRACWLAGIGLISDEEALTVSWKGIAIECILKDGFCKHPRCGAAILESNGTIYLVTLAHSFNS